MAAFSSLSCGKLNQFCKMSEKSWSLPAFMGAAFTCSIESSSFCDIDCNIATKENKIYNNAMSAIRVLC